MRRRAALAHPAAHGGVSDFDYVTVGHVTVDVIGDDGEQALGERACGEQRPGKQPHGEQAPGERAHGEQRPDRQAHGAQAPEERTHGEQRPSKQAHGERRPGGGAFYSALQAARLGLRTLILTKGRPQELEQLLEPYRGAIELRIFPAAQTTTLATSGTGAERRQRVIAWAGAMVEPIEVDTTILHLAPIARETPSQWRGRADFVGITPQGLMREWRDSADRQISLAPLAPEDLPEHFDALVVSEGERPFCKRLLAMQTPEEKMASEERGYARAGAGRRASANAKWAIAITAGSASTTVVLPDGTTAQVAVPAVEQPRDDLGAGDVFAAAFFIALRSGLPPTEAAAYGNAAAAVRIAGIGPEAIGDRLAIEMALRTGEPFAG
jgi:sugar/nucleoside kinase (ribokinase family)